MDTDNNLTPKLYQDRDFEEVEGGYYDANGWYITPNGSFWDDNRVYFNREGLDKYGGTFDEYGTYIPGPGWNEEFGCYETELEGVGDNQLLKQAIQQNITEELLEEYNYYQRFFINPDANIDEMDVVQTPSHVPFKDHYADNVTVNHDGNMAPTTGTQSQVGEPNMNNMQTQTPSKFNN